MQGVWLSVYEHSPSRCSPNSQIIRNRFVRNVRCFHGEDWQDVWRQHTSGFKVDSERGCQHWWSNSPSWKRYRDVGWNVALCWCYIVLLFLQVRIFQPPHKRLEDAEERQRDLEQAFEDMYMMQTGAVHWVPVWWQFSYHIFFLSHSRRYSKVIKLNHSLQLVLSLHNKALYL